jgi:hypothetical protein
MGALLVTTGFLACSPGGTSEEIVFANPIQDLEGVLTRSGVELDRQITSDGNGSIKISAADRTTVRLYEVEDINVEDTRLLYRARVRTDGVKGQVYLEMWCRFPGRGEFFSRALHAPVTGTTEWTSQETGFSLEKNQKPDLVKLNIVLDGSGTVWVDDLALVAGTR